MARKIPILSDSKCDAAKPGAKEIKLFDGQGLYLAVKPSGAKTWRLKFTRPDGRAALATFGNYPALGLVAARIMRDEALALLVRKLDLIEEAKQAKVDAADARSNTFKVQALEWHAACARKWSAGHAQTILRRLEINLFPALGERAISELKARDLLAPLKLAEKRDNLELASRLRQNNHAPRRPWRLYRQQPHPRPARRHGHRQGRPQARAAA